jgi:hypothetical protein
MKRTSLLLLIGFFTTSISFAQPDRWQQRINYQIDVNMNVETNKFNGTEKIDYWNNSPDTLHRVFFHVYWNAFQPNSSMDVRSRELGKIQTGTNRRTGEPTYDWDDRVKDRISKLKPNEIGYQKVAYIKINGRNQQLIEHETILEVKLDKPILPKSKVSMDVAFEAQVPVQIRRSGRDNAEGVRYSMAQWYPKMVEYDYQGWNANPYIAREFYGVWGDYHVNINIDKSYLIAATGTLENANQIGFGYETAGAKVQQPAGNTLKWSFDAKNVHDFVWAADPNYKLIKRQPKNGPIIYVVYKRVDSLENRWQRLADTMELAYPFIEKTFGKYPYKNYTFIQGGDGGMEYPMATLIKNASVGTAIHEWMHTWYQMLMGTNESLYPWMDEGFTSYAASRVNAYLKGNTGFAQQGNYRGYFDLVRSGRQEPASTHSDHYNMNYSYSNAAYSLGAVFMSQLGYIVGEKNLDKILLEYYNQWHFKHPNPNDFIRVAEKVSGMELDWYKEYLIYTTKSIDYGIGNVNDNAGKAEITLKRVGAFPMPIDVLVTYKDGTKEMYYIPMNLMYGAKPNETEFKTNLLPEWRWTHPEYSFQLSRAVGDIREIEIDQSQRLADLSRTNNKITVPQ